MTRYYVAWLVMAAATAAVLCVWALMRWVL